MSGNTSEVAAFSVKPWTAGRFTVPLEDILVGAVTLKIGIEPTVRHAADLGYVPVVDTDAGGGGNGDPAERSLTALRFGGDALLTTAKVPPP
ncbi:hypothetical protein [Streptomyces avermitilis]|uniref:hypothetical protein n=1 Tax=Streptomyces avermitilis TaxID=33903 RepID=UPI0033BA2FFB